MKVLYWVISIAIIAVISCKKWKYEQVRIHGRVVNVGTGTGMAGEQVNLLQIKDQFLGTGNTKVIKTVTTNSNGEYDFGGLDLRKKDNFRYEVHYVHGNKTWDGFCDYYEVDKQGIDINKDLALFGSGSMICEMLPNVTAMESADSVKIEITTSSDFSLLYCNPEALTDYADKKHIVFKKEDFSSLSKTNPFYGGNANYYLKIIKLKGGSTTIAYDTVYVAHGYNYQINW